MSDDRPTPRTGAERYLEGRLRDPRYRRRYEARLEALAADEALLAEVEKLVAEIDALDGPVEEDEPDA